MVRRAIGVNGAGRDPHGRTEEEEVSRMLVADLSSDVAGRFCTRLLALGGADVVLYRDPGEIGAEGGGDTDRLDAYLGSHKWTLHNSASRSWCRPPTWW
jgi:crotonobetainyl-CoA:carnitine CoA-transferase CaiB-like acyl-CoA transferase